MYKLSQPDLSGKISSVIDTNKVCSIPFDPANTDYQKFKLDLLEGAELQDADGNVMTPDAATIFISNLP